MLESAPPSCGNFRLDEDRIERKPNERVVGQALRDGPVEIPELLEIQILNTPAESRVYAEILFRFEKNEIRA